MSEAQDGFEEAAGTSRRPTGAAGGGTGAGRGRRGEGRVGVTYKYFGAPDRATAARVPTALGPGGLGLDAGELGTLGRLGDLMETSGSPNGHLSTKIKPETMSAMVLTGIQGVPLHQVPPLELVVLHPDYAVVQLPHIVVEPLRKADETELGAAAFIWSTVPDRRGPRDAFVIYTMLHEWQDFANRLHDAGHQLYCLVWP
ncbi:hypothetical protein GCM10010193_29800 [Kitasatospora atroaurantiaca]|uniref:Uncharacterized protein n=1 Tax=Kitasatospora atroaurantiaca TaxID=285545 RepID=A0A561EQS8_9ACTN|nr:hypothetical protein FB465_3015 [Kitasatospora atroaurantiaca]